MAAGDLALRERVAATRVRVETGVVVSLVPTCGPVGGTHGAFSETDRLRLAEIIATAEQASGLRFGVYVGDLGPASRERAVELLDGFGDDSPYTVLIALSPGQRIVEIVTGIEAALRIEDRGTESAAVTVAAAAKEGDLYGAVTGAVRVLTDQAGPVPDPTSW